MADKTKAPLLWDVYRDGRVESGGSAERVVVQIQKPYGLLEIAVGRDRVWGWGRGATYGGEAPRLNPHERLPYPRAYVRTTPCPGCPFSRTGEPEKDGGADPLRLIGQAHGPFVLPCHREPGYEEERQGEIYTKAQCAGAAIFRSNIGLAPKFPKSFHVLPADTEKVFATPAELLAKYGKMPPAEAEAILAATPPQELLRRELAKNQVRVYGSGRKEE